MIILRWIANAIALLIVANIVPGFSVDSLGWALVAALILGLANITIRPILLILTLPINILTLGLFTFVINAVVLQIVAAVIQGFAIDGFGPALLGALLLTVISWIVDRILSGNKAEE